MSEKKFDVRAWLSGWASGEALTASLGWVFASGIVGAALAWTNDLPLWLVYLVAMAAAALGLVMFAANSVRRSLSSPKYKIVVEAMAPLHWQDGDDQKVRPRLFIRNHANFPIEVDAKEISWEWNGSAGEQPVYKQTNAIVPPFGNQIVTGAIFTRKAHYQAPDEERLAAFEVFAKVKMTYGKSGRRKYRHDQQYRMRAFIYENGASDVWIEQVGTGRFA